MSPADLDLDKNILRSQWLWELMVDEYFCAKLISATGTRTWYKYCPTQCSDADRVIGLLTVDFSNEVLCWSSSRAYMAMIVWQVRRTHYKCEKTVSFWKDVSFYHEGADDPEVLSALKYLGWIIKQ